VSERRTAQDFESRLGLAVQSYASGGVRAYDPARISAQARSAGAHARWTLASRLLPVVDPRVLRFALVVVLLGVALVIAAVASRRADPPSPVPGLFAVSVSDRILVGDPSSGAFRAITTGTTHDGSPVWSPDGTRIAFSNHLDEGPIQIVDADGGNRHAVSEGMNAMQPAAWSPDNTRIAFVGSRDQGPIGLWVVGADGTGLTQLVSGDIGFGVPAWSSDGSMIAFARTVGNDDYVHVVDVATGVVTLVGSRLTHDGWGASEAARLAWQPGRMRVLYARAARQLRQDIVVAERIGGTWQERPLITGLLGVATPTWLDGERFVFVRFTLIPGTLDVEGHAVVAGVDGTIEGVLGEALVAHAVGCVAPDGSAVAIMVDRDGRPPTVDVMIVPTDGRPATRIPNGNGWVGGAAGCSWQSRRP
jgi:Tol biopolymer transport system component